MNDITGDEGFYTATNTTEIPILWEQNDILRVLKPELSASDKVLLVLGHYNTWVDASRLQNIVEYSNRSNFRSKVLKSLHAKKSIEYDSANIRAIALPPGLRRARELH